MRVADIEYAWNFALEDLSKLRAPGTFVPNGTGPIVAAAAASLSSIAKQRGITLAPNQVRAILKSTGTPQVNPGTGNIGPLPNLRAAIAALPTSGNPSPAESVTGAAPLVLPVNTPSFR